MKTLRKIPALVIVTIIVIVGAVYLNGSPTLTREKLNGGAIEVFPQNNDDSNASYVRPTVERTLVKPSHAPTRPKPVEPPATMHGTPAEAEVVRRWEHSRGRYHAQDLEAYRRYGVETLEELAAGGDMKAMMVLSELYVTEPYVVDYGLEAALSMLRQAAVHGSSEALGRYASGYRSLYSQDIGTQSMRPQLLESLAWQQVADLRGDALPNSTVKIVIKAAGVEEPTLAEKDWIQERAKEIYNELLSERLDRGLGDFDNDVPVEVSNFFARLEAVTADTRVD